MTAAETYVNESRPGDFQCGDTRVLRHGGNDADIGEIAHGNKGAAEKAEDGKTVTAVFGFRRALVGAVRCEGVCRGSKGSLLGGARDCVRSY